MQGKRRHKFGYFDTKIGSGVIGARPSVSLHASGKSAEALIQVSRQMQRHNEQRWQQLIPTASPSPAVVGEPGGGCISPTPQAGRNVGVTGSVAAASLMASSHILGKRSIRGDGLSRASLQRRARQPIAGCTNTASANDCFGKCLVLEAVGHTTELSMSRLHDRPRLDAVHDQLDNVDTCLRWPCHK